MAAIQPPLQPPLQRFELAELFRVICPGVTYLGDPPEKWSRPVLLAQLRVHLAEIRGGTRLEAGEAIREQDERIAGMIRAHGEPGQ
jgi:hypothetical protein